MVTRSVEQLVSELHRRGVKLWVEGARLRSRAPKGAIDTTLRTQLRDDKEAIIAFLSQAQHGRELAEIPRLAHRSRLPLSYAQQRLWFLEQIGTGAAYHLPTPLRLQGQLDVTALRQTLSELVRRHESLRTTFGMTDDGTPYQIIHPEAILDLPLTDLRHLSLIERETHIQFLAEEETLTPFDLNHDFMLRAQLLQLSADEHVLLLTMHHIASDGWSMGVLVRELAALYEAFAHQRPVPLPDLPIQYADFAHWQRQWLQGEILASQLSYWTHRLSDAPPLLPLPTDYPRPPLESFRGGQWPIQLDDGLRRGLVHLSQTAGTTLFMTLLGAFQVLMKHYSGQDDIVVGSPIANRNRHEIEPLIGFFVNTLALRVDLSGSPTFRDVLEQVKEITQAAYQHQDLPFERLVEELELPRSLNYNPVVQVMFALQNAPMENFSLPGLDVSLLPVVSQTVRFDLEVHVWERPEGLSGFCYYRTDLFEASTIARMMGHFERLLREVVAQPEQRIDVISLLSEAERHQLLVEWNATSTIYPDDQCVPALFEAQAERTPDAVAVVFDRQKLTYRELNQRANQLAQYLMNEGVKPSVLVGICVERSVAMVVAMLGILKAGGAYLPLDPDYPAARLAFMLDDAQVSIVLTQQLLAERLPAHAVKRICLDRDWATLAVESTENPPNRLGPDQLAYVIYTSGSTGRPKGVMVPHRAINRLVNNTNYIDITPQDRMAQASNASFDAATFEIWGALLHGACLVGIRHDVAISPQALAAELQQQDMSILFLTTALFNQVVSWAPDAFQSLRYLLFGGEAVDPVPVRKLLQHGAPEHILHVYGPTENTTFSSWYPIESVADHAVTVPIGAPIANTQIYVLDGYLEPVPVGVSGELYIGGDGLALGYLNQPQLTEERFVANPFGAGRLYKTGDLARYRRDGQIEFLGRVDDQVKLRGFRIELGEIEAVLNQHPAVQETVVVVSEDEQPSQHKHLVAYIVSKEAPPSLIRDLRRHLSNTVPDYMVPAAFVLLNSLPLTPNGKVDRRALPVPQLTGLEADYEAPQTLSEELLAAIWCEVLGLPQVGRYDNFFDLGGHSLLATQVLSRIRDTFEVTLPVRTIFEAASIAELALALEAARQAEHALPVAPRLRAVPREESPSLSFAQQRLWFLDQMIGPSAVYNLPQAVRVQGALQVPALEHAVNEMIRRHEALRTTFPKDDGEPVQCIHPNVSSPLVVVDLQSLAGSEQGGELHRLMTRALQKPFDLARGPLLHVILYQLNANEAVLLVNMHHIVSDGWSMGVLWRELDRLYRAYVVGERSPLPDLDLQYVDFSEWQRAWLTGEALESQLAYWRQQLMDAPTQLELPTDHPRPLAQSFNGQMAWFDIAPSTTEQLQALSRRCGTSLFMTLHAAFSVLLSRYSGQEDIVVGSPIANRHYQEIEPLIGFFVNTLPLRVDLSGHPTFEDLLKQVRQVTLDAYMHQDIAFEQLVSELGVDRHLSHSPLFQVGFAWEDLPQPATLGEMPVVPIEVTTETAKFDLMLFLRPAQETEGGLRGTIEYNTDLFERATIERLIGHFQQLLLGIVADPAQPVWTLPMLTAGERHQLLVEWNATEVDYPRDRLAHQLVEAQAHQRPQAHAVVDPHLDQVLTYGELNQRANQLAHYLRHLGVGPEVIVAVCLPRSLDMIVAYLAVLKAGGAYTPIDASYPTDRIAFILSDTQAPVLLTHSEVAQPLTSSTCELFCLDRDWSRVASESQANPANLAALEDVAYVVYTSGSTGRPKGSQIPHRALLNLIFWYQRVMAMEPNDHVSQAAGISFDVSVSDIWPCLTAGASLYLPWVELLHDPEQLQAWLVTHGITKSFVVTPVAERLLNLEWPAQTSLEKVMAGGEKLHRVPALHHPFEYFNGYGPSECTMFSVFCHVPPSDQPDLIPPIGRPVDNTQLYILDPHEQPVPIGVYGELCISGDCVSRGYLNRPDLTDERFVRHPFCDDPDARLYKTGDLVRYLPSGEIEYLGRADGQVKIRGFRIELGEIETVLSSHAGIQSSTALVWETGQPPGDKRLVAYVVPEGDQLPDSEELRVYLQEKLPDYMLPAVFVPLSSLPLNANGKVDRRALPAPDWRDVKETYVAPHTPVEEGVARIWCEVLEIDQVGVYDDFFAMGGHSLLATQITSRIKSDFGLSLPVRALFEYPTIARLAERIEDDQLISDLQGASALISPELSSEESEPEDEMVL